MAKFIIRQATSSDEPVVSDLLTFSYSKLMQSAYEPSVLDDLLPIIGKANPSLLSAGTYYLAETPDGTVIGAGGWTEQEPGQGGRCLPGLGHLRHFGTHPDWAGQGVGRAIFERCLDEARSRGVAKLQCYASLNAVDFYAKLGFKALRRIDVPTKRQLASGNDLIMKAMLMERII